ncbi:MAG: hypothetical protein EA398_10750 [Deltaproteobacteria bacterium]|nr:MAG: hypothetical protein EA398_10750 [Deltaproteobacteria bacterium]
MVGASAPAVASEGGGGLFPGTALLQELRAAAVAAPACGTDCVETASLTLDARDGVLTVRAEVHARAAGAWRVPGPESAWVPSEVRLDGAPAVALRRVGGGHLLLRVPEGVSRVELRGVLRDRVTLGFGEAPRVLVWEAEGWLLDGLRPDAAPPVSVHLTREVTETAPREEGGEEAEESRVELPPSLRLERRLEIGIPWMVHYRLVRQGGTAQAVRVRVPLLPGENLVTDGVSEEDGQVLVALEEGRDALEWSTTMTPVDTLVLEAASDVPWSESWTLVCSTLWHCRTDGLVPVALTGNVGGERVWSPTWLPWPGESVTLSFNRPGGVEGQTITVDRVDVGVTGGRRLRTTVATMTIRASRGGRWTLGVPAGAEVQRVSLDGRELPAMQEEGSVAITLPVGQSQVRVELREEVPGGMLWRGPSLELQGGASNVHVNWTVPEARWLLWTQGPRWGPVVTLWHWFPVLLILAFVLGRWAPTPLGTGSWLLLGLGMTQIFWLAPFLVVAWLVLLGVREKWQPESPDWHNVLQIGLGALTFAAFIVLVAAVVNGLALRPPDMQVVGGGSFGNQLRWYADRSDGALPGVALLTLPLWVWHVAMLAWALWLAGSLVRWVRWGWAAAGVGGMWRKSPPFEPVPPPVPPPGGGGAPPAGWGAPGRGVPPVPGPPFGGPPSGSGAPFGGPPSGSGAPFGGPPSGSGAPFGGPPSGSSAGGPAPASEGGYAGMGGGQRPGGSSAGGPAPASEAGPGGPSAGSGAPSVRPPSGAAPSAAAGPEAPGDDSPPDR